jgi:hypothetical protein
VTRFFELGGIGLRSRLAALETSILLCFWHLFAGMKNDFRAFISGGGWHIR